MGRKRKRRRKLVSVQEDVNSGHNNEKKVFNDEWIVRIRLLIVLVILPIMQSCNDLNEKFVKYQIDDLTENEIDSVKRVIVDSLTDAMYDEFKLSYFIKRDTIDYFLINNIGKSILGQGATCYGGTLTPKFKIIFDREIPTDGSVEYIDSLFTLMINGERNFERNILIEQVLHDH